MMNLFFHFLLLFLFKSVSTIVCEPECGKPVNSPIGEGKGIFPGRVVWAFSKNATKWDGKTSFWWTPENTDFETVTKMTDSIIKKISGQDDLKKAWEAIFQHFNLKKSGITKNYEKGEKIAIKVNLNGNAASYDGNNGNQASPQFLKNLCRHLVYHAGVAQEDITFFDAARLFTRNFIEEPQGVGKEFPNINFVDNHGEEKYVEKVEKDDNSYFQFSNTSVVTFDQTKLPTIVTEAKYIIEIDAFRAHDLAGITMTGKNWFGSIYRPSKEDICYKQHTKFNASHWCPITLHPWVAADKMPMGSYNVLVDLLGHDDLSGKGLLFFSDALYGGPVESLPSGAAPPIKFKMKPFNNWWSSSLFVSMDPIALDSVAFDFLRAEPNTPYARVGCIDNYLHESALADNPPSKTVYNPTGKKQLSSLGVHEHWNNVDDKLYSRNMGKKKGIELIQVT